MYSVQITMKIFIHFVKKDGKNINLRKKRGSAQDENAVEDIY